MTDSRNLNPSDTESVSYEADDETFVDDKSVSDLSVIFEEVAEQLKNDQPKHKVGKSWAAVLREPFNFPKYLDNPIYDVVMLNFSPEEQYEIINGIKKTQLLEEIETFDFMQNRTLPPLLMGLILEVIKSRVAAETAKHNRKERQKSEKYKLVNKLKKQERAFAKLKRETKITSAAIRDYEKKRQEAERRQAIRAKRIQED